MKDNKEEDKVLAEFAIVPTQQEHFSSSIALAIDEIKKCQVQFNIGPMGTALEGTSDQVFLALRKCFEKLSKTEGRLIMTITLDSRTTDPSSLSDMINSVETQLISSKK